MCADMELEPLSPGPIPESPDAIRRVLEGVLLARAASREVFDQAVCVIDDFKRYNDALGHLAGDDCLRRVAGALRTCLRRPTDPKPGQLFERLVCHQATAQLASIEAQAAAAAHTLH